MRRKRVRRAAIGSKGIFLPATRRSSDCSPEPDNFTEAVIFLPKLPIIPLLIFSQKRRMSLIKQCQKKSSYQLLIAKRKIQKYFPELAVNKHILRCLFLGGHLLDAKKDVPKRLEQMKTVIGFEMGFKLNIRHILQQKQLLKNEAVIQ